MPEEVARPEYSTVAGLALFGARARRGAATAGTWKEKLKSIFASS
jgi:hypothetical protein